MVSSGRGLIVPVGGGEKVLRSMKDEGLSNWPESIPMSLDISKASGVSDFLPEDGVADATEPSLRVSGVV